jgi:DNA repair protein RecN (Recombination protein N)
MLKALQIKNLATISELCLEFDKGLNIISGETGTGKSVLVRALKLVLGDRALSEYVRTGEAEAEVEARFVLEPEQRVLLGRTTELGEIGGELVLRRIVSRSRQSRCFIDGKPATVAMLAELGERLVEVVGQHQQQSLLRPEEHLEFLDGFGKLLGKRREVHRLHRTLVSAQRALRAVERDERDRLQRLDVLEHQIAELEELGLEAGERDRLESRQNFLAGAEEVKVACQAGFEALYESDESVASELSFVTQQIERVADRDSRLAELGKRLRELRLEVEDVGERLRDLAEEAEFDPEELERVEERLVLLQRMRRKYGDTETEMLAYLDGARTERDMLSGRQLSREELEVQLKSCREQYFAEAGELSERRRKAASRLCRLVEAELGELDMVRTKFAVRHESAREEEVNEGFGELGLDRVEFLISPNPGEDLKALHRIASGGELSRILLALKTLLCEVDRVPTLVFDEIDTGIGGRVARTLGEKLSRIAGHHQVLCVTHLPQIASLGQRHLVVNKTVAAGRTLTQAAAVDGVEREQELARLLGGKTVTDSTLKLARELLEQPA